MKAVVLSNHDPLTLEVREYKRPVAGRGEVIVKLAAAPINPSDLVFLRNQYGVRKALPVVPGFEGAGTVVEAGSGLYAKWLVGKRVACRAPEDGDGTWAEFMRCSASACIPLKSFVTLEQGASLIVNPLTAWCLLDLVRRGRQRGFVQTAAASALGRMIARLSRRYGLTCLNIVRRPEQVELLKKEGAVYALNSSEAGFKEQLDLLSRREGATIALDAVGGELTGRLAGALPPGSRIIVFGALSGESCAVSPGDYIFRGIRVEGFWLTQHVKAMSLVAKLGMAGEVQRLLASDLRTDVQARFRFEKVQEAIELYKQRRTEGKVLLVP